MMHKHTQVLSDPREGAQRVGQKAPPLVIRRRN